MANWFECKVKYLKTIDDGTQKRVTEPYLVDAINFTEAEKRIIKEMHPYISGDFEVTDIKRSHYQELFESTEDAADKWYRCKLEFITMDEKKGKERKATQSILVQAADLRDAVKKLDEGMKSTLIDYTIKQIDETAILDVFHYEQLPPDGFVKKEDTSH